MPSITETCACGARFDGQFTDDMYQYSGARVTSAHSKFVAKHEACKAQLDARQSRLDEWAKAALTGLLASPASEPAHTTAFAKVAWDMATAMESERSRRIRAQEGESK